MAYTLQNVLDSAATDLQDPNGTRFAAADRLEFCNDAIGMGRSLRPDLFLSTLDVDYTAVAADQSVPLSEVYRPALVAYVKGRCLKRSTDQRDRAEGDAQIKFAVDAFKAL